ncbi:hypothetical protein EC9_12150 [Rosistilla ulvae]|uniref:Amine oxidase domain-containing protein n=1 Tax=Rosistilla ulvae TaxID=1930277 RepID=A0A517LWP5_9BACT|nr:hypothetical protein [Rosistilla ulvae]QDS87039.1 hypothetical protein EC9_12150 [Rosistilla ulvae]
MNERANTYDDAVIGSSPMMLLVALELANKGRRVCLIDRSESLGGAWETVSIADAVAVEGACHLIEVFPGVYEYLEKASGASFVELDEQPIRIHRSGIHVGYHNRLMLMMSGFRLLAGYTLFSGIRFIQPLRYRDAHLNYKNKLKSFIAHQTPGLFRKARKMKGPEHGFVDFMNRLVGRCMDAGVALRKLDVESVTRSQPGWTLAGRHPADNLVADRVHCTTSTNLTRISEREYSATPRESINRAAVLTRVLRTNVNQSQTYVSFWKDQHITRIARIDSASDSKHLQFLVELRTPSVLQLQNFESIIRKKVCKAKIARDPNLIEVIGSVNCVATRNTDQLPAGEISPGFHGYYSMGNLAAGIASWLKHRETHATYQESAAPDDCVEHHRSAAA